MYLKYGNYTHSDGEAQISFLIIPKFNEGGQVYEQTHRWMIQGLLFGSSATDLDTKWNNLQTAYSVPGLTIGLYHANGSESCRLMRSQDCVGGVRITEGPSSQFEPGMHTTFLPYQITVEGDYPDPDISLVSFTESLEMEGGGPAFVHLEPLLGKPVKQQTKTDTAFRAIQEGKAVGYSRYPTVPPPIFGAANLIRAPKIKPESPQRSGPIGDPYYTQFPITWQYIFESAAPLRGIPNRWI